MSPCVQRTVDDHPDCYAREWDLEHEHPYEREHPLFARRLRSPWGEHWPCEEYARDTGEGGIYDRLMLACKKLYVGFSNRKGLADSLDRFIDVWSMIAETGTLRINDVETVSAVLS